MKQAFATFVISAAVLLCSGSQSFGSLGGVVGGQNDIACGATGTLYENLTAHVVEFDIALSIPITGPGYCSSVSLTWIDAHGHGQSLSTNEGFSTAAASSLPGGGAISWTSAPGAGSTFFSWEIQHGEAPSLNGSDGGESGQVYANLTTSAIGVDFAGQGDVLCSLTFSWTDAAGQPRTLSFSNHRISEGVSTSLPPGGAISWNGDCGIWQITRFPAP